MDSVRLWHGTTASAARRIANEGFKRPDSQAVVVSTAEELDVDHRAVFRWLQERGRFVVVQEGRDEFVSFATSHRAAAAWAQRAPEARWEALWAIWCVREDRLGEWSPWKHPQAAAWHVRQLLDDEPAVVEVRLPAERLYDISQGRVPAHKRDEYLQLVADGILPEVTVGLPMSSDTVVGWSTVERRIGFTAAAGLLGKTVEELTAMVDSGEILPCHKPDRPGLHDWYWTVDDLALYRVL